MKILVLSLLLLASVSQANPTPRLECQANAGLTFLHVNLTIVPDANTALGTAYVQLFQGDVQVIKGLQFTTRRACGLTKSYIKNGVLKLVRTSIDGEDLGWKLSIDNSAVVDVPMDCKEINPSEAP